MPHSYYIIHLEDKGNKTVYAQLRRFAYPGAFSSSVWDEFDLKEYDLHPVKVKQFVNNFTNERKMEMDFLSWSEIVSIGNNEDYQYILRKCKEIFIEKNHNIGERRIQL